MATLDEIMKLDSLSQVSSPKKSEAVAQNESRPRPLSGTQVTQNQLSQSLIRVSDSLYASR